MAHQCGHRDTVLPTCSIALSRAAPKMPKMPSDIVVDSRELITAHDARPTRISHRVEITTGRGEDATRCSLLT
jgi:hypothetical protein